MSERSHEEDAEYVIRPMSLDDLDQVMEIERVAFPMPWPRRAYQYEITENRHSTMLVVESGDRRGLWQRLMRPAARDTDPTGAGRILGYGGFWLLVDEIHICTLAVDPDWQGRGLGELLLVSLLERGMASGAQRGTLEVRVSNIAAQRLYQKCGFEIVSRQSRYYADNNEDAYIMATAPFDSPVFRQVLRQRRAALPRAVHGLRLRSRPAR